MHYYKTTIQYDGSNYFGFQWQKDIPSIQNDINITLGKLIDGKVTTMGASRTDSGVHAFDQIVRITSEHPLDCVSFLVKLNDNLPPQIRSTELFPCQGTFNPIKSCISKEYRYFFTNTLKTQSLEQKFIANNPFELDIKKMRECAEKIVGRHDFHNFCSAGSNVKTTVREVLVCELTEINPHEIFPTSDLFHIPVDFKSCYQLRIVGTGFLKQMVRHLMSALWHVGQGRMSPDEFMLLLDGPPKTRRLWKVASPRGLFLYKITYEL